MKTRPFCEHNRQLTHIRRHQNLSSFLISWIKAASSNSSLTKYVIHMSLGVVLRIAKIIGFLLSSTWQSTWTNGQQNSKAVNTSQGGQQKSKQATMGPSKSPWSTIIQKSSWPTSQRKKSKLNIKAKTGGKATKKLKPRRKTYIWWRESPFLGPLL